MIELIHLKKAYENGTPLTDVNTTINEGDVISIIGPSGTGKSTLLRCLNIIDMPTAGKIIVGGEDVAAPGYDHNKWRKKTGMVFQQFNLFNHLTVIENIMKAPIDLLGKSKQEAYDRAMELLRQVGLADRALQYPEALSGGQKQRVAIARTLAMDPQVILFDEPTSALDPTMVGEVEAVIRELSQSGTTMLIVTHDLEFARSICNRVFYMDQGGIYEDGTPEEVFDNPKRERTQRFIRQLKVLEMKIESHDYDFLGEGAAIDQYCNKHQIAPKVALRIRSAVEELVQQILLPVMDRPEIHVTVEYEDKHEQARVTVLYGGEYFDPADSENDLAYTILEGTSKSLEYSRIDATAREDGYTNEIIMIYK